MLVPAKITGLTRTTLFKNTAFILLLCLTAEGGMAGAQNGRQAFAAPGPPGAAVTTSRGPDATTYSIINGDCEIKWIAYTTEANKGVVKYWARCPAPLEQQIPFLARIFEEFLARDRNAPSFRTLFWGGLVPERRPASLEMPLRLALAAHRSPAWDVKRGRPAQGDLNRFVRDLANQGPIYPELKELFGRFNRSILVASVEKVRVLEAGELPFFDELKKQGVQAADKLPFDCMVWFGLSGGVHPAPDRPDR